MDLGVGAVVSALIVSCADANEVARRLQLSEAGHDGGSAIGRLLDEVRHDDAPVVRLAQQVRQQASGLPTEAHVLERDLADDDVPISSWRANNHDSAIAVVGYDRVTRDLLIRSL